MALILIVLLLALLLGGLGFAIHILWWIALVVLVVWILGFLIRVGEGGPPVTSGTSGPPSPGGLIVAGYVVAGCVIAS